jgi:hypothetical protein
MGNHRRYTAAAVLALCAVAAAEPESAEREDMARWQWFMELSVPRDNPGRLDCVLTPEVFDKAREDLGDLRLIDGNGREIPYALRVRRTQVRPEEVQATTFNQAGNPDGSAESSLDLGPKPPENRSLTVETDGANYRRRARVEGSDDRTNWRALTDDAPLVNLRVGDQAIDARTITYPASRFRYLRVRVFPDKAGGDKPNPPRVQVWRAVEKQGEDVTIPVTISPREPIPTPGGPGSAWYLSVPDGRGGDLETYWERLSFDVANTDFSRSYYVEAADPKVPFRQARLGEGTWQAVGEPASLLAALTEVRARRLRLVVIDNRDPPLRLQGARSTTAVRQLVFTPPTDWAPPIRLYFGNPNAEAGRYNDYVAALPAVLDPAPTRVALGTRGEAVAFQRNPDYREPPKPFTERFPWLIYVVLSMAGLTLLGILTYLARRAVARHDATTVSSGGPDRVLAESPPPGYTQ